MNLISNFLSFVSYLLFVWCWNTNLY